MSTNAPEIHVLDHKVRLFQAKSGFRTSLDSVFVAAACPAKAGDSVLDLGAGVGGASFCLLWRVPDCHVTGVEIQNSHTDLATANIALNKAEGRAEFVCADIRSYRNPERFDHVICNPPYLDAGTYTPSSSAERAAALGHTPSPRRGEGRGEGSDMFASRKPSSESISFARNLRKNQTDAENALWAVLRSRQFLDLKFKRQHPVPPYTVDFVCLENKLVVEIYGGQHAEDIDYDLARTDYLQSLGFKVVRFWNNEVLSNLDGTLEALKEHISSPSPQPSPQRGEGAKLQKALALDDWVDAGFHNLKSGGSMTIIHRADYTDKIILALGRKFGAVEIIPLYPKTGDAAKRVIVRALKDRRTPAKLHAGVILHEDGGAYTRAANAILRDGASIG